jgi:OFA family oxalate/formate antiporter-like MFS transporter
MTQNRPPSRPDPTPGDKPIFYGWVMLPLAMAGVICTAPGQTYTVSVFNQSFRDTLGLSHTQLTGAYMLGTFLASLPLAYVGAMMDRLGPRRTKTVVVVLFGLACLGASQVQGLVSLFFAFFFLRLLGQGALGLISTNALAYWFNRRLGTVTGICNLGVAGAIAVVPGWTLALIDALGWRGAYAALGLAVWGIMLPLLATLYRDRPEQMGQAIDGERVGPSARPADSITEPAPGVPGPESPSDNDFTLAQAIRTRAYWIAGLSKSLWAMLATAIFFNIVPLFESRGVAQQHLATLYTLFAAALAGSQLVGGWLADHLPIHRLLAASMVMVVLSMCVLRWCWGIWMVPVAAVTMGLAQGLLFASLGPMWLRYFGRAHLGKIRGSLTTLMVASTSVGPFVMGLAYDQFGSYDAILTLFVVMPIPLAVLCLTAKAPVKIPNAAHG